MENAFLVGKYPGPEPENHVDGEEEKTTTEVKPDQISPLALVEILLKDPARVNRLNRIPSGQRELLPRFLLIGLGSYLVYALVMALILNMAPASAYPTFSFLPLPPASWSDGSAWGLVLAYTISIVLAACVCLPAFYFYSLLAGLRMTWLQIVSVVGRGTAASSIMVLGLLPIYLALVLGLVIFQAPAEDLRGALVLGLLLPFLAGLWGLQAIYRGVMDLFDHQAFCCQDNRRCFLRRLTLSWAAVYTAVLPIMIYRLWELFTRAQGN